MINILSKTMSINEAFFLSYQNLSRSLQIFFFCKVMDTKFYMEKKLFRI